ncbi:hypothetical protein Alfi_2190 [Alistipes finegoldii DSM 17242]|jgi:hypothetical protein|uniref:OmpA family n=3 Tax=Alistipes TaxID=239759 RepID=I3YNA6_ALIFI|nr:MULTISPECIES: hypothetical protein [Alistipes]AFL78474.1 hypothetical protein Alfi_2190 [Alistipes finegoldii DSM 17242]RGH14065.1 hypothetical protein DWW03_11295 [Alistipes sp. AF14-19]CCZ77237.1 uncharacterized protein BN754_00025 [Alistipes finegoldii CAG:68]
MKTIAVCLAALLCGCSITGHLERRQYRADVLHVSREQYEREQQTYQPPALKIERDSNRFYLVPTEVQENGERIMAMQIQEVTIRATTRTLPERLGKVTIDFVIDMPRQLQGTCRSIAVIPYLHKYGEAHPLQDITIRGGLFSRVQDRDYWQYNKYLHVFNPSEIGAERAFARFVKYPYSEGSRLDSIVQHPGHISYYYSQEVPTDETSKTMLVTLQGWVMALDESYYKLPPSDTLTYHVSSMLSFADTTTRYKIKIIEKYATVQDRNYIQFRLNDTHVLDSLGRNAAELDKIRTRMAGLIGQREFFVDSIVLTASASPEGRYARNSTLAQGRAHALKGYLRKCIGPQVDTLMQIRWIAEDWHELTTRIRSDENLQHRAEILKLIDTDSDPDRRERTIRELYPQDYQYLKESVYPSLRAVTMRYDLRRVGMVKDTIHTREVDTAYMRGINLLQKRKYAKALYILNDYRDRNTVITLLSLGYDAQALEMLNGLERSHTTEYLKAVACARLGRKTEGREHFLKACELDERMLFRGNLDPEIAELLKN